MIARIPSLPNMGTTTLHVLIPCEPAKGYEVWADQTTIWGLLPDEFREAHGKPWTNNALLSTLPHALLSSTGQRSRTAMRVDEIAIPLQRLFAEHYARCDYRITRPRLSEQIERSLVAAAGTGETALERALWFYETLVAPLEDQFPNLSIVYAEHTNEQQRGLNFSFAYGLFLLPQTTGPRCVAIDMDLESTQNVRSRVRLEGSHA